MYGDRKRERERFYRMESHNYRGLIKKVWYSVINILASWGHGDPRLFSYPPSQCFCKCVEILLQILYPLASTYMFCFFPDRKSISIWLLLATIVKNLCPSSSLFFSLQVTHVALCGVSCVPSSVELWVTNFSFKGSWLTFFHLTILTIPDESKSWVQWQVQNL